MKIEPIKPSIGARVYADPIELTDPAVIKAEVLKAGFELAEDSKLLAYPTDDHTQLVFAPGLRGMTDQSVFKFRKPGKGRK